MVRSEVQVEFLHWTPVNPRKMTYLFTLIYERRIASVLQDGGVNWIIFLCWNLWYGNYSTNILLMWNYYYFFYSFNMVNTIQVITIFVSGITYWASIIYQTQWQILGEKGSLLWPCLLEIITLSKNRYIKKIKQHKNLPIIQCD